MKENKGTIIALLLVAAAAVYYFFIYKKSASSAASAVQNTPSSIPGDDDAFTAIQNVFTNCPGVDPNALSWILPQVQQAMANPNGPDYIPGDYYEINGQVSKAGTLLYVIVADNISGFNKTACQNQANNIWLAFKTKLLTSSIIG